MEHLNRLCKEAVNRLGANKAPTTLVKVSKALGIFACVLENIDMILCVPPVHTSHTICPDEKDLHLILKELHTGAKLFDFTPGRYHRSFPDIAVNYFNRVKPTKLHKWMKHHFSTLLKNSFLYR